jgi:hypothetical protein
LAKEARNGAFFTRKHEQRISGMRANEEIQSDEIPNDVPKQGWRFRGPLSLYHEIVEAVLAINNKIDTRLLADPGVKRRQYRMLDFSSDATGIAVLK